MAGTRAFALVGSKVFPPIDRVVSKVTGGRVVLSAALVPSLVLTTTGRKSGQQRRTPLATLPIDDDFLVVGSNFGKDHHPAWTTNLLADPKATVTFKGQGCPQGRISWDGVARGEKLSYSVRKRTARGSVS